MPYKRIFHKEYIYFPRLFAQSTSIPYEWSVKVIAFITPGINTDPMNQYGWSIF